MLYKCLKDFRNSSLWTSSHRRAILRSQNKNTDFFMILACLCHFNSWWLEMKDTCSRLMTFGALSQGCRLPNQDLWLAYQLISLDFPQRLNYCFPIEYFSILIILRPFFGRLSLSELLTDWFEVRTSNLCSARVLWSQSLKNPTDDTLANCHIPKMVLLRMRLKREWNFGPLCTQKLYKEQYLALCIMVQSNPQISLTLVQILSP